MTDARTIDRDLRIVIIGAGMSGLLAAIRLESDGYGNFVILEKGDKVAGTWRENRYPGLTCDVPSHSYTYSFEPNPDWSQTYPPGPEIFDYFAKVAAKYGVNEKIEFNKEVVRGVYEDGAWTIETGDGEVQRADAMIVATGLLHHPRYPDIPGLDSFAGAQFHSARWDESVPLDGRRIGVIGSGSTGVQIVAALAGRAKTLTHFTRTAQWIMPAENTPFSEEQRAAFHADPSLIGQLHNNPQYMEGLRFFSRAVTAPDSPEMAMIEERVRQHLESSIADPELRERLRPNFRAACRRMIISPDYYERIQTHDVAVVTDDIERVEPEGVRTVDGKLHELDVLVLATGFKADAFMRPMNVIGRGGVELNRLWERRPSAYLAISIPNFPNLFMLNGPSAPFGNFSSIDVAEKQMDYVLQLMHLIRSGEAAEISVKPDVMAEYNQEMIEAVKGTIWSTGCTSWYLDKDGVPSMWPYTYDEFVARTRAPILDHFDLVA